MATNYIKNLGSGTLASAISASTTSLSVYVGAGNATTIKAVWPSVPFYASIMPAVPSAGVPNSLDSEIVKVTAVGSSGSNTTLTVTRAQRGTTAKAFSQGAIVTCANYADDAVLLGDDGASVSQTPWIGTDDIENEAVNASKINWGSLGFAYKYIGWSQNITSPGTSYGNMYPNDWNMTFDTVPGGVYLVSAKSNLLYGPSGEVNIVLEETSGLQLLAKAEESFFLRGDIGGPAECKVLYTATGTSASVRVVLHAQATNSVVHFYSGMITAQRVG